MKQFLTLGMVAWLGGTSGLRAQSAASAAADMQAATEIRAQLTGKIQDLSDSQDALKHQIDELKSQVQELRDQQAKPNTDVVQRDELRKLAEQVQKIDDNREKDKKLILDQISKLANVPVAPVKAPKAPKAPTVDTSGDTTTPAASPANDDTTKPADGNYEGYQHTVKSGETLIAIVKAYNKEYDLKLTVDQVLKHPLNAKVKPEKLYVGQKVFIPSK
jgi:TolA-binding protein